MPMSFLEQETRRQSPAKEEKMMNHIESTRDHEESLNTSDMR